MSRLSNNQVRDYLNLNKVYLLVVYSKPNYVDNNQTLVKGIYQEGKTAKYEYQRTLRQLTEQNDLRVIRFRVRLYGFPPGITRVEDLVAEDQSEYLEREDWVQRDDVDYLG